MEVRIRPATSGDLSTVAQIVKDAYTPYIPLISQTPGPLLDDYEAHLRHEHIYVAERWAGRVEGILVLISQPEHCALLLDNVAVAPAAQGGGIGKKLIQFAEREAVNRGFERVRLYTNEVMTTNLQVYTRMGYYETERVVERGLNRVYMAKAVKPAADI